MATTKQIQNLKEKLLLEKEQLQQQIKRNEETLVKVGQRESVDELSSYDNHPADMGTELFDKERISALNDHAKSQIEKTNAALEAINEGNYGYCKVCGNTISLERLEAVPATLHCFEHAQTQNTISARPVEEEVLIPSLGNHFENRRLGNEITDKEDSFAEVARFGTSETPSDYSGDYESYDTIYDNEEETEGFTEEYEAYIGNDVQGKNRNVYPNKKQ
ncbi:TraR/DksA C4-type zinc finger protein [Peribacillus sp. JNUCC 23]